MSAPRPWLQSLRRLGACSPAVRWAQTRRSWAHLWRTCERGDWMLWLLGRLAGEPWSDARRPLVACAAEVAEQALVYVTDEETDGIVRTCLQTCTRWSLGDATDEELRDVQSAACVTAYAVHTPYAATCDTATAAAAWATRAAAAASSAAAAAAWDASSAAAAAAWDASSAAATAAAYASADIVRRHYPRPPRLPRRAR